MNHTGDPIEKLDHKHFQKVMDLANRIEYYKNVGPACTEAEWNKLEEDYQWVDELLQRMIADEHYKIYPKSMKKMNHLWKKYEYGNKISKIKQTAVEMLDAIKNIKNPT